MNTHKFIISYKLIATTFQHPNKIIQPVDHIPTGISFDNKRNLKLRMFLQAGYAGTAKTVGNELEESLMKVSASHRLS